MTYTLLTAKEEKIVNGYSILFNLGDRTLYYNIKLSEEELNSELLELAYFFLRHHEYDFSDLDGDYKGITMAMRYWPVYKELPTTDGKYEEYYNLMIRALEAASSNMDRI